MVKIFRLWQCQPKSQRVYIDDHNIKWLNLGLKMVHSEWKTSDAYLVALRKKTVQTLTNYVHEFVDNWNAKRKVTHTKKANAIGFYTWKWTKTKTFKRHARTPSDVRLSIGITCRVYCQFNRIRWLSFLYRIFSVALHFRFGPNSLDLNAGNYLMFMFFFL